MIQKHRVRFQGHEWIWAREESGGGVLTSQARLSRGEMAFAGTDPSGGVWRAGRRIGAVTEIEILQAIEPETPAAEILADVARFGLKPEQN